jgi:hypothetical protein
MIEIIYIAYMEMRLLELDANPACGTLTAGQGGDGDLRWNVNRGLQITQAGPVLRRRHNDERDQAAGLKRRRRRAERALRLGPHPDSQMKNVSVGMQGT